MKMASNRFYACVQARVSFLAFMMAAVNTSYTPLAKFAEITSTSH